MWKQCFMATLWTGLWHRSKCYRPDVNSPSPQWNYECWRSENVLEVWMISHARCHLLYINDMSSDDPPLPWPISLSVTRIHASTGAISFLLRPRITDGIHVCNDRCIYYSQIKKKMCQSCVNLQKYHRYSIVHHFIGINNIYEHRGWTCSVSWNWGTDKWRTWMCCSSTADPNWSLQSALHCFAIFQHDSLAYFLQRAASLSDLKPIWISSTCPHFTHSSWDFLYFPPKTLTLDTSITVVLYSKPDNTSTCLKHYF